jgi:uncharacterized protein (DUF1501 family)
MDAPTRRRFLKAAAAGGLLYAFGRTPGSIQANAASVAGFSDYKALVCVYLLGGNDSWSMVVPTSQAEYDAYAASRQNLAIARDRLLPITPIDPLPVSYGLHPLLPALKTRFETGQCAFIANVGPLIAPLTRDDYLSGSPSSPPQLFSHNEQQNQWYTLRGRGQTNTGWAGRVADLLIGQVTGPAVAGEPVAVRQHPHAVGAYGAAVCDGADRADDVHGVRHNRRQAEPAQLVSQRHQRGVRLALRAGLRGGVARHARECRRGQLGDGRGAHVADVIPDRQPARPAAQDGRAADLGA